MHRIDYPETHTTEGYCSQISMEESADHRTVKYRLDLFQTEQDRASKRIKQVESLARSASADEIDGSSTAVAAHGFHVEMERV